jgi:hypothetical protein
MKSLGVKDSQPSQLWLVLCSRVVAHPDGRRLPDNRELGPTEDGLRKLLPSGTGFAASPRYDVWFHSGPEGWVYDYYHVVLALVEPAEAAQVEKWFAVLNLYRPEDRYWNVSTHSWSKLTEGDFAQRDFVRAVETEFNTFKSVLGSVASVFAVLGVSSDVVCGQQLFDPCRLRNTRVVHSCRFYPWEKKWRRETALSRGEVVAPPPPPYEEARGLYGRSLKSA